MTRVIRAEQRGPKRIPAVVLSAEERAEEILANARVEAEALRAHAVIEGREEARAELAAERLAFAAERERMLRALEPQTLELALLAAKHVIGQELATRHDVFAALVAELVGRLRRAQTLRVQVHPEDASALASRIAPACERLGLSCVPRIEAVPELARGDCIVVSELGTLDARIETRLAALARALEPK